MGTNGSSSSDPAVLIGREAESEALLRLCETTRSGTGNTVLVAGETGVGVTRLLRETLGRSGLAVFTGRAREEATPPYGPFMTVLRGCLRAVPGLPDQCGPLAGHLAALLPELGPPPQETDPETLVEAVSCALSAMSSHAPASLFLDDLHWADNATLELIPRLDEQLQHKPVLIVAAFRGDEITRVHPVRRLRHALRRAGRLNEITVGPLDAGGSAALVASILGSKPSPALARLIFDRTRGIPLYIEELTSALKQGRLLQNGPDGPELPAGEDVPVPEGIRDAVIMRLESLSPQARGLVDAAAVAGAEFDLDLVAGIAGAGTGFDELRRRGLIDVDQSGRGSFRHTIVRDAVRDEIGWSRRRSLHHDTAAALQQTNTSPEVVAEHWLSAKEPERARLSLLQAADFSCRVHAYRDAARAANRALELWPAGEDETGRVDALTRYARCAQLSGQLNDAVKALREVLASKLAGGDPAFRAEALRSLATVHQVQGAWEQTVETRRDSAVAFEQAGQPAEAAVEWLALAGRYTAALFYESALEATRTAARLADGVGNWDTKSRAMGLEGNILAMQGKRDEGRARVHEGLSLALEHNLVEAASEVYRRLGSVQDYSSDYRGAVEAYSTAINYCRAQGADEAAFVCLGCVAYIVYRTGDWKRALEICREITDPPQVEPGLQAIADVVTGMVRAFRGETKSARRMIQSSLDISRRFGATAVELAALFALAVTEQNEGNNDEADRGYRSMIERWQQTSERHDIIPCLCWAATFFADRGRVRATTICTEALATIASETGNPEALAGLAHALGEAALLQDKPEEAEQQFGQAVELLSRLDVPLELSLSQFRAGVAMEKNGKQEQAAAALNRAYRLARKLGARPLADRIAAALESAGEKAEEGRHPDAGKTAGRGGLTRRQVEIARLLADGLTNKEIAHRLYLSPRTVDMHVGNILDRLDCRSRTEAARRADELGLLE
jgi:DNA-binding NarL/FixJ family response regulator